MAYINLKEKKYSSIRKRIEDRLKRRGFKMIDLENWEVHGPHEGMNYEVWIGGAQTMNKKPYIGNRYEFYIAVYPRQIFIIDDPSDWGKTGPENLI